MQPPISIGTVLQDRYRITQVLEGGMVRTYLGEDQECLNQLCVLQEIVAAQAGTASLKSTEPWQKQVAALQQIRHPQLLQVRSMFEQEQRLFLVQDYFVGKTYATLLKERQARGETFSQAEVLRLIQQLLPVLAHIHSHGIIHRNISPASMLLRESDCLPVLIDFGAIKELASKLLSPVPTCQLTAIGLGYAPIEQVQTGKAYPSSDFYSLAVTAVVLLTGQELEKLFDDIHLSWNWQRWVTLDPILGEMLNRMLSFRPFERYHSVVEVAQALQTINPITLDSQHIPAEVYPKSASTGAHELVPSQVEPVISAAMKSKFWYGPWAIAGIYSLVALAAGISVWLIVSFMLARQQSRPLPPQSFPSPLVTESPTPTIPSSSVNSGNSGGNQ